MRGRAGTASDTNSRAVTSLRRLRQVVARALGVALLALSIPASAQTTTTTTGTALTSAKGNITLNPSAQGIDRDREYYSASRPWWISYEDCLANDKFTFHLSIRDNSNPLEIWAGSENCATNRSRTDRGQCWIVAQVAQLSDTVDVEVPVRNILLRNLNTTNPPAPGLPATVCDNSTDPSGEALTFYIMLVDSGQADEYIAWDGGTGGTGFDVVGPDPPGSISVGVGESQLAIKIKDINEDSDREAFEAFCVPAGTTFASIGLTDPDSDTTGDAGTSGEGLDAGEVSRSRDAGNGPPAACFTEVLRSGRLAPSQFSCGTARETSSTLRTSRLVNDQQYAVALSARDRLGNAGVASTIECGRPTELDDFFELYSRADGHGGGGFCSVAPGGAARENAPRGLALLLAVLAGFGLRRKKGDA